MEVFCYQICAFFVSCFKFIKLTCVMLDFQVYNRLLTNCILEAFFPYRDFSICWLWFYNFIDIGLISSFFFSPLFLFFLFFISCLKLHNKCNWRPSTAYDSIFFWINEETFILMPRLVIKWYLSICKLVLWSGFGSF